jgi:dihydroxyacid dehydratase/phosphogluconate dehydratase
MNCLFLENPVKANGHLQMLYGNLATEGSVAKISGKDILCQKTNKKISFLVINW